MINIKQEILKTLIRNKSWFFLAALFFLAGITASIITSGLEIEILNLIITEQQDTLESLAEQIFSGPPMAGAAFLFVHNFTTIMWLMFSGIFLGLFPLLGLFLNGLLMGVVTFALSAEGINPFSIILLGVMPHGILELPALFIGAAMGLKMGFHIIFPLQGKKRWDSIKYTFKEMVLLLPLLLLLLVGAALIEIFVTPLLLNFIAPSPY